MVVDASTLDNYIAQMPSDYAAMSPLEFFAELYSLYYDYDDPQKYVIDEEISLWLDTNVGVRDINNPRLPNILSI